VTAVPEQQLYDTDIAPAAALMADPTRAAILRALLPGRPLAAGELARMAGVSPALPARSLRQSREAAALAQARTCYDHLAGRAGVELLDAMLSHGLVRQEQEKDQSGRTGRADTPAERFEVTGAGAKALGSFGIDISEVRRSRRHFAGACIDWTQRRGHLNGALAAAITSRLFELGWIERGQRHRSVCVTPAGFEGLACTFGVDLP
jgi:helix-turn-helix protein